MTSLLERIVVALDGSLTAERALGYAVPIAGSVGADVVLARAVGKPGEQHAAETYLAPIARAVAGHGVPVRAVVGVEEPARLLDGQARTDRDLIVLASHGRSGLGRWTYGSVAEQVLLGSRAPVLLVRAWSPPLLRPVDGQPIVLAVPLDGSVASEAALPVATELARGLKGAVVLVGVVDQQPAAPTGVVFWGVAPPQPPPEDEAVVSTYLDGLVAQIRAQGIPADRALRVGMPAAEIADAAHDAHAAFIVMATHGQSGVPDTVIGPVALAFLHLGNEPVLFVRPD